MSMRLLCFSILVLGGVCPALAQSADHRLSLKDAVQRALVQNRDIKVEAYSPQIAQAYVLASQGRFDPEINFGRDYSNDQRPTSSSPLVQQLSKTDSYRLSLDGSTPWGMGYSVGTTAYNERSSSNGFASDYQTFGGITVTQPLLRNFGFSANLYEVRIARADRRISEWVFRQTVIDTATRVIVAYSELLLSHEVLRVSQRSRELAADLLVENEKRFKAGGMSENQLVQARARTAARAEAIILAHRSVRDADNALRRLIGEEVFPLDGPLLGVSAYGFFEFDATPAADLEAAYELRPDYQQARLSLTKKEAGHAYARNQLMPRLDLVGGYGYNGLDSDFSASRRMVADREHRVYTAGVVMTVPLTFARERGRLRAARLEQKQAEEAFARMEQEVAFNLSVAAGQIRTAKERVAATRLAFELASEALEDELKKLRAGTSSTFVVLSLQESLSGVELSMHRALAEQRIAAALYDRETGRTLERNAVTVSGL
jgi:outer membrane protein TolC